MSFDRQAHTRTNPVQRARKSDTNLTQYGQYQAKSSPLQGQHEIVASPDRFSFSNASVQ